MITRDMILEARESQDKRFEIAKGFEPLIKKCIKIYVKDISSFDDAMQEGYLTVLSCIKKYDVNSNYPFAAYVKRAVIYSIRDFSRRIKFNVSLDKEINEDGVNLLNILKSDVDIEGEEIKLEDILRLKKAVEELPEKQRRVIEDFYFKNISMREISKNRRCHYMSIVKLKDRAIKSIRSKCQTQEI